MYAAGEEAFGATGGGVSQQALQAAEHVAAELRMAVGPLVRARLRTLYSARAHQLRRLTGSVLHAPSTCMSAEISQQVADLDAHGRDIKFGQNVT